MPASPPINPKHNVKATRQAYYDKIGKKDLTPLWEVLRDVVTKEPKSNARRTSGSSTTSRASCSKPAT